MVEYVLFVREYFWHVFDTFFSLFVLTEEENNNNHSVLPSYTLSIHIYIPYNDPFVEFPKHIYKPALKFKTIHRPCMLSIVKHD